MSQILRVSRVGGFTTVQNKTIRDNRLSWKATGFLMYLLSCAEGWNFNLADLSGRKRDKSAATRSAKAELVHYGYLKVTPIRVSGKIVKWEWHVFEEPLSPDVDFQQLEIPHVDSQDVEIQPQRNIKTRSTSSHKELQPLLKETDLRFSKAIDPFYKPQIIERFSHFPLEQVQAGLDELAAAIEKREIKNPIFWLDGLFAKGVVRTKAGIIKSEQRKAA